MKVFALSDFHLSIHNPKPMDIFGGAWVNYLAEIEENWRTLLSEDDVMLIGGDTSWAMTLENVRPDLGYLSTFPGKKILIRGNHDYWWHSIGALRKLLPPGMFALQNDALRLGNLVVCGTRGWTTPESGEGDAQNKKLYDRELIRLKLSLDHMKRIKTPGDRAVVMLHYPPFNSRMTDSAFTELIGTYPADAVIYGHLHGKNSRVKPLVELGGIPYHLTSCDLVGNKPVMLFEI
ncbi:MAG: metallophosphoesterase [Clostridiales bacterium]|nr:metallophosphoesterase [Clostridiales bacterium]